MYTDWNQIYRLQFCLVILVHIVSVVHCSKGDQSWTYRKCLERCRQDVCLLVTHDDFYKSLPLSQRLLGWDCIDECKYACTWHTVENFEKDGTPIPQFHGKWPFKRILGIQEPASTVFSLLNGATNLYMILKFRKRVPSAAPMYYVWHSYAVVCITAWFWSTAFHSKDTHFTECMDYFCALSLVMFNVFMCFVRILGASAMWRPAVVGSALLVYYFGHVYYLGFVNFDYGYNMKANIFFATFNVIIWMVFLGRMRQDLFYINKAYVSIIMFAGFALLELLDFPPILWILDAHALWHFSTIFIPFIWYSFAIDDCLHLLKEYATEGMLPVKDSRSGDSLIPEFLRGTLFKRASPKTFHT